MQNTIQRNKKSWIIFGAALLVLLLGIIIWHNYTIKGSVNVALHQVDTSNYPEITLYYQFDCFYSKFILSNRSYHGDIAPSNLRLSEVSPGQVASRGHLVPTALQLRPTTHISLVANLSEAMSETSPFAKEQILISSFIEQRKRDPNGREQIELWGINDRAQRLLAPTDKQSALNKAVNSMKPAAGSALYDVIYAALESVAQIPDSLRHVVVFTNGGNQNSQYSLNDLVAYAPYYQIPVTIFGLSNDVDPELKVLAKSTKGFYDQVTSNSSMEYQGAFCGQQSIASTCAKERSG